MVRNTIAGLFIFALTANAQAPIQQNSITVDGHAELVVPANEASFEFQIKGSGPSLRLATVDATKRLDAIVKRLNVLGIPSARIQVSSLNSSESLEKAFLSSKEDFQAIVMATVHVDSLPILSEAIYTVAEGHIHSLGSVDYSLRDYNTYEDRAKVQAIANAKQLASRIALECGVTLKTILNVDASNTPGLNIRGGLIAVPDQDVQIINERVIHISATVRIVFGI
jgi:uncharacterized protein YggE